MTMRVGDWQSESDMESIPNSFDGYQNRIFDMLKDLSKEERT